MTCVIIHAADPTPLIATLSRDHPELSFIACDSYAGLPAAIEQHRPQILYSIRFDGTPRYPRDALFACETLQWIAIGGSGVDHLAEWDPERVTVTNAAGVAADIMAEYVMGHILYFSLDIPGLERDRKEKHWRARIMQPLQGKTLLIVGLGHTGQAIARRAQAFDLQVCGVRARPQPTAAVDHVFGADALPELWPQADFITVAAPLRESTRGLINENAFAAMKPSAVLIDVSRGGIVEETALLQALQRKQLAGAALDVFEQEPLPPEHPLWSIDTVVISPHCSSVTADWEQASIRNFSKNLRRWLKRETLHNIVDPARGY